MIRLIFSILSRKDNQPKTLNHLLAWIDYAQFCLDTDPNDVKDQIPYAAIGYDKPSIYQGHMDNLSEIIKTDGEIKDNDVIILIHDDVEILSTFSEVYNLLTKICNLPKTGIVGVAGGTRFDGDGIGGAWWRARATGLTRGLVFQGKDNCTMTPNLFGDLCGQVVVLDGLMLAMSYKRFKELKFEQPYYLSSKWDFYDIDLTLRSHLMGYNNYVLPILVRHESSGYPRAEWDEARLQFLKFHNGNLPVYINHKVTGKLPI